jgi:MEDS: MEthanogen/methylotroph, DcmR Sensory domain
MVLDTRSSPRRPVRGIGEPIWPGRRPEEILEIQLHEALLNIAVDPEIPFWLVCPYDAGALSPAVIDEAHRSHPAIVDDGSYQGSAHYAGRTHADSLFAAELPELPGPSIAAAFSAHTVGRLQSYIRFELHVAGLPMTRLPVSLLPPSGWLWAVFTAERPMARCGYGTRATL